MRRQWVLLLWSLEKEEEEEEEQKFHQAPMDKPPPPPPNTPPNTAPSRPSGVQDPFIKVQTRCYAPHLAPGFGGATCWLGRRPHRLQTLCISAFHSSACSCKTQLPTAILPACLPTGSRRVSTIRRNGGRKWSPFQVVPARKERRSTEHPTAPIGASPTAGGSA